MRLILMGVSGSGKTTLGQELAASTGWPFLDGDDFHTPEARAKMADGLGLSDAERQPWLERLRAEVLARPEVILACSSLRHSYRDVLRVSDVRFVFLHVPQSLLLERLRLRGNHYAHANLLPSQLQTLELPDPEEADVLTLHVTAQDSSAELTQLTLSVLGVADALEAAKKACCRGATSPPIIRGGADVTLTCGDRGMETRDTQRRQIREMNQQAHLRSLE